MARFLMVEFEFRQSSYYSLILCKAKRDSTAYRITVMNGDLEKQLNNNNIIEEIDGTLRVDVSGNSLPSQIRRAIGKALGKLLGKPVKEIEKTGELPGQKLPE